MNDKGLFGTFDYDRDVMQPPIEKEELYDNYYWNGHSWEKNDD